MFGCFLGYREPDREPDRFWLMIDARWLKIFNRIAVVLLAAWAAYLVIPGSPGMSLKPAPPLPSPKRPGGLEPFRHWRNAMPMPRVALPAAAIALRTLVVTWPAN